jgi:hypothetical protein
MRYVHAYAVCQMKLKRTRGIVGAVYILEERRAGVRPPSYPTPYVSISTGLHHEDRLVRESTRQRQACLLVSRSFFPPFNHGYVLAPWNLAKYPSVPATNIESLQYISTSYMLQCYS